MATETESGGKLEELDNILEDIALTKAIAEGEQTPPVSRESVFDVLGIANLE